MKYEVEIDIDDLIRKELYNIHKNFANDIENKLQGMHLVPVFSQDDYTEIQSLVALAESARVVHNYYATPEQYIESYVKL